MEKKTMSRERFEAVLMLLGDDGKPIPQAEAAELADKSVRQIRNYINGEHPIPLLVAEKFERILMWASSGADWRKKAAQERARAISGRAF